MRGGTENSNASDVMKITKLTSGGQKEQNR